MVKFLITCTQKYDSIIAFIEKSKDIAKSLASKLMGYPEAHEKILDRRYKNYTKHSFRFKINMQSQKYKEDGRKLREAKQNIIMASILHVAFAEIKYHNVSFEGLGSNLRN